MTGERPVGSKQSRAQYTRTLRRWRQRWGRRAAGGARSREAALSSDTMTTLGASSALRRAACAHVRALSCRESLVHTHAHAHTCTYARTRTRLPHPITAKFQLFCEGLPPPFAEAQDFAVIGEGAPPLARGGRGLKTANGSRRAPSALAAAAAVVKASSLRMRGSTADARSAHTPACRPT